MNECIHLQNQISFVVVVVGGGGGLAAVAIAGVLF